MANALARVDAEVNAQPHWQLPWSYTLATLLKSRQSNLSVSFTMYVTFVVLCTVVFTLAIAFNSDAKFYLASDISSAN